MSGVLRFVRELSRPRPLPLILGGLFLLFAYSSPVAGEAFPTARWESASPESQGLDSAVLAEALEYVRLQKIPAHSFLIVRNGRIVLDAYFYPYLGREVHDIASVTKSVTSILVGIAIEKGYLKGVDQKVVSTLSSASHTPDARKEMLVIRHLLTMTSGLDCDTEGGERALAQMRRSEDWAAFALDLPMRADPGSQYAYCSCNNHLLSSLVTAAAGESLLEFGKKNLFRPLGIMDVIWPADSRGRTHGWGDLHLRPHDMAKLGYLYLHEGRWGDNPVVPASWVQRSSSPLVTVRDGVAYGYSWWINTARPPIFEAVGRGGQRISILPKENMVVVFTGGGANTDQIAPFLFRAIRSDRAIADNTASQQRLKQALRRASSPTTEVHSASMPALSARVTGSTYSLAANPIDLRSIRFDFKSLTEAKSTLQIGDAAWVVPTGLDGKRRFAPVGPHGLPVATIGRWLSESEFLLDLDTVANINHLVFNIRFDGDKIFVRMNETTGEMRDVEVAGVALKTSN